ncbi:hypothetical protein GCM10010261_59970 [Streptomyces pilosus]|nr:hypothetical protein GCM10010261_59970 [Streptomyces pilosus]
MPSHTKQLTIGRQLTASPYVLNARSSCPTHSAAPDPGGPGPRPKPTGAACAAGSVLDYRSAEQPLQSHADLRLTPLRGRGPEETQAGFRPKHAGPG